MYPSSVSLKSLIVSNRSKVDFPSIVHLYDKA
jgi:hypothetical protein